MSLPEWRWTFTEAAGVVLDRPISPAFTARFDAEQWLGENWRDLAGRGVAAARLWRGDAAFTPVPLVGTGVPSEPHPAGDDVAD